MMINSVDNWQDKVKGFCNEYNIPLEYLSDTLYEPKVIPMIRGKAFEFTVMLALQNILPKEEFKVNKQILNAQFGAHDEDLAVIHRPTGRTINIECKLAGKGRFRHNKKDGYNIAVKCMRSRTVGSGMAERLANLYGVSKVLVEAHADSYREDDFDVVITSIGNAFYKTNDDGLFYFDADDEVKWFLIQLNKGNKPDSFKDFAFSQIYIAPSSGMAIHNTNGVECTRRNCPAPRTCGFIPNYPKINFGFGGFDFYGGVGVRKPWMKLSDSASVFRRIAQSKASV